jgi:hypothetical protein
MLQSAYKSTGFKLKMESEGQFYGSTHRLPD